MIKQLIAFCIGMGCFAGSNAQAPALAALRCENRQQPIAVDAAQPRLSWELVAIRKNTSQSAYRVLVSEDSMQLAKNIGYTWDSKKVLSGASIQVPYNGQPLQAAKKYFWKVMVWDDKHVASAWSTISSWQMGLPAAADWKQAQWIGMQRLPDTSRIVPFAHGKGKKEWGTRKDTLPLLRKTFTIKGAVKRATVFISGLGHFEMSINGVAASDHFLDPGWTQYSEHALYVGLDITRQIRPGLNALGVMLGNGFYYIPGERYRKLTGAYGYPVMICRMVIEYKDGSTQDVISDDSWKVAASPIIFSSIYGGEDYNAGLEQKGWNTAAFNDSQWKTALISSGPPMLEAQSTEPLRVMQRFLPQSKKMLKAGTWVYDLGQNFSGIPSITVSGNKGDTVRLTPAELINADGSANQKASGIPSYFTYILKGGGTEHWHPRFSYYGFRYVQAQVIPGPSAQAKTSSTRIIQLEGWHTRNAAPDAGQFNCSSELFRQTNELIRWAIKSNMVSLFTDCPHREKLGWLEQTHLVGSSVQYNFDIAALCRKVIRDMMFAQTADGLMPEIAPEYVHFDEPFRDSPEWGSAAIILPWQNYQWYGDLQTLAASYDMMKRYIGYLDKKSAGHILTQGLGDWYDIGPNPPGVSQLTPMGVTGTATFYYDLTLVAQIARLLNKEADAKEFDELGHSVKDAFNHRFLDSTTNQYASGSQAANAMALFMQLVPDARREAVLNNLVADIQQRKNSLTAGDIGYRYVLRALEDGGRSNVIYDMNSRTDVPGYGYQLKHGATALTESWQAFPTVSNNHFMLGHLMEWFYAGLCGIKQTADAVAYNKILIQPQPVGNISSAGARYHSPYGMIACSWKKTGGRFTLHVTIPANSTATIQLPDGSKPIHTGSGSYQYSIVLQ